MMWGLAYENVSVNGRIILEVDHEEIGGECELNFANS
jgi:hypothetical protein